MTEKIKLLRERFQVVFTIALIFPVLFDALAGEVDTPNYNILSWGIPLGAFILSYVLIELWYKYINKFTLLSVNVLMLIQIIMSASTMFIFSHFKDGILATKYEAAIIFSVGTIILAPIMILGVLLLNLFIHCLHYIVEGSFK